MATEALPCTKALGKGIERTIYQFDNYANLITHNKNKFLYKH